MRMAREQVASCGVNRKQHFPSLKKNIFDYENSAGQKAAVKIVNESRKEKLEEVFLNSMV